MSVSMLKIHYTIYVYIFFDKITFDKIIAGYRNTFSWVKPVLVNYCFLFLLRWSMRLQQLKKHDIHGQRNHCIPFNGQASAQDETYSITVDFTMAVGFARDPKLLNAPDERFAGAAAKECKTCLNTFRHNSHMIHIELHSKCFGQNWFTTAGENVAIWLSFLLC